MKIRHLLIVAMALLTGSSFAQQLPPLPIDPAVRMGKLANGLTYYVRQNGYPEHRVNFYIAQRVGSIQENEDQRGLAHFLEHMAFNGSEHFKGNNLIEYTRSLGVSFGGDLNAYTGVDQTVYRVCNVPSTRVEALDSCLLILKDWSNGLLLEADEIDKERGVIHEEWRLRTSPVMRMLERNLETLYPNSKYGRRMPIGLMEVVDNFEPDVLRRYYKKWYRPDNQAIIVVGDIDVDRTEAKIKELFGTIPLAANAAQVVDEPVPDNAEPIVVVDKDKEQQTNILELMFKHDAEPDSVKGDMMYMVGEYAKSMVVSMLNSRLNEETLKADCPFLNASCEEGPYIFSKTKDAFTLDVMPKEGKSEEALAAAFRETMRAVKFGFTATEYARQRAEYLSRLEKVYTNRSKRDNSVYGNACRDHFLDNEPLMSIEDEYQLMNMLAPQIPVDIINEVLPQLVSQNDSNVVVLGLYNDKEGIVYPSSASLLKAINDVRGEQLTAYVDNVKDEPLIKEMPAKGKIVGETENSVLGFKKLQLSNGMKVILKQTDFKDDEIRMSAYSKGGSSLLPEKDRVNCSLLGSVVSASGLGEFTSTELEKAMAGKQASVSLSLANLHESVSGSCTPKDLETMMQLTYLTFTNIKKDEQSFTSLYNQLYNGLRNVSLSPERAFSDSLRCTFYDHNPRFASLDTTSLAQLDYDRVLQIARERTANAGDYTFIFVGNFEEEALRGYIEQYLASLPDNGVREDWRPVTTYHQGHAVNSFIRKMETPKAQAVMYWYNNKEPYTLENGVMAEMAGQVLEMIYLKKIREDAGAAYSAGAGGQSTLAGDVPLTVLLGQCPMKPEMAEMALTIMRDEAKGLCSKVDSDMLTKVKELMLKEADDQAKKNGYWMAVLSSYDEYGVDIHTDYKKVVSAMTPERVAQFVKKVIFAGDANSVEVVMMPEQ